MCTYSPETHCSKCLPAITHTKLGPCLIFSWGEEEKLLTVDLIPVFPVEKPEKGVLELFDVVIKTLIRKRPENWLKHLKGIIERDRILPESFTRALDAENESNSIDVAMKLLNYGPCDNSIIRPGQVMQVEQFQRDEKLKKIYIYTKALKDMLSIDVKTYVIKKIILQDEIQAVLRKPDVLMQESLFTVLSHPELREKFQSRILFETKGKKIGWSDRIWYRKEQGRSYERMADQMRCLPLKKGEKGKKEASIVELPNWKAEQRREGSTVPLKVGDVEATVAGAGSRLERVGRRGRSCYVRLEETGNLCQKRSSSLTVVTDDRMED